MTAIAEPAGPSPQIGEARWLVRFVLLGFVVVKIAIHLPWLQEYGWHRDEMYFRSCGLRLDWGYADHAPFVPWIARFAEALGAGSLLALRLHATFASTAALFCVLLLARKLGGGVFALSLTGVAMLFSPVMLRTGTMFAIPSFEPLFWVGACLLLLRALDEDARDRHRLGPWLTLGAWLGLALLVKHTTLMLGFGFALGLLLTRYRSTLLTRGPWIALLVAIVVFSPNLIWQAANDWPTFDFASALRTRIAARISRGEFLAGQLLYQGPINLFVWLPGLLWVAFGAGGRFRIFAWTWATVLGVLVVLGGKIYYASPAYLVLFAAGGVACERWLSRRWPRVALAGIIGVTGAAMLPLTVPVLPIAKIDGYAAKATLGLVPNAHEVTGDWHDMLGWPEHARAVRRVWDALPPGERKQCLLGGSNYGNVGCLERFGDFPPQTRFFSNHLSWHFWGPPEGTWPTAIVLGGRRDRYLRWFEEVELVERSAGHEHGLARRIPIWLCRKPRGSLESLWPQRADL